LLQLTKTGKNIPNYHRKYQHLPLQDPPKFTQIWLENIHLANLFCNTNVPLWLHIDGALACGLDDFVFIKAAMNGKGFGSSLRLQMNPLATEAS
jgi:hypothetical protein